MFADRSPTFSCKARWWASPTCDPNAGKSPACAAISGAFSQLVEDMRPYFYPIDHFVGVGNNGKIREGLRKLEGVLLLPLNCNPSIQQTTLSSAVAFAHAPVHSGHHVRPNPGALLGRASCRSHGSSSFCIKARCLPKPALAC